MNYHIHGTFGCNFNLVNFNRNAKLKSPPIDNCAQHIATLFKYFEQVKKEGGGKWPTTTCEDIINATAYGSLRFPSSLMHNNHSPINGLIVL